MQVTRCADSSLKMHLKRVSAGLPQTRWGAYSASQAPYLDLSGRSRYKGMGREKDRSGAELSGQERQEQKGSSGERGDKRKGRRGDRRREGNLAPTVMVICKSRHLWRINVDCSD